MPMLLAAGVYWLHQLPEGPTARGGDHLIQIALLRSPESAAEAKQASVRPDPPITDFQAAPSISPQSNPSDEPSVTEPLPPNSASSGSSPHQAPNIPGSAQARQAGEVLRFQRLLLAHIRRYQRYPAAARRDGMQGTVLIGFAMRRDGGVMTVSVKSSSGKRILDEEAAETVRRAQPLPSIPSDMPEQLTVLLPVAFDLR